MLLKSSSLLLQWCPAYLFRLTWMVLGMEGKWQYNCCFMRCCFQDLFKTAWSIVVLFPYSFYPCVSLVSMWIHPYSHTDIATAWKNSTFIISDRSVCLILIYFRILGYIFVSGCQRSYFKAIDIFYTTCRMVYNTNRALKSSWSDREENDILIIHSFRIFHWIS